MTDRAFYRRPAPPVLLQGRITSADDIPTRAAVIWQTLGIRRDDGPEMIGHIVAVLEAYALVDREARQ